MDETIKDLFEDLSAQAELFESGVARINAFCDNYAAIESSVHPEAKQHILKRARSLQTDFSTHANVRRSQLEKQHTETADQIDSFLALKHEGVGWLRTLYGELGPLLVSADWQSPSFLHALSNHAGVQSGKIVGTVNDYKRDVHLDASEFEKQFRRQYIDAPKQLLPNTCVTSSGMSAFSTLLTHLVCNQKMSGPVLVGKSSYFQNKILLEKFFGDHIEYVDENDTHCIIARAKEIRPRAIFLDTLCNDITLSVPDLKILIPSLLKILSRKSAIVLDNST
ncbi:MAG: hypothetical protein AAB664_03160, partial [Patescibacteria group bacterium]